MKWRKATMIEAFNHARYRDIDLGGARPEGPPDSDVIVFTDLTAVAVYCEDLPEWMIYE